MTSYERKYEFTLSDLLDRMTIDQIKEVLLPTSAIGHGRSLELLSSDVTVILESRRVELSGRILRLLVLLAQLNLHSWRSKDRLDKGPENYTSTVRHGADLNGIRNGVLNLLQDEFNEASPSRHKVSFFSPDGGLAFRQRILADLERDGKPEAQSASQ